MTSRFERFMAARYLRSARGREEGRRFVRFITYVAVGGVALGVAALLLALSIVRGFSEEIEEKIVGFGAHVQVESYQDAPIEDAEHVRAQVMELPGVARAAGVIQEFALLRRSANEIEGIAVWGTDEAPEYIQRSLIAGSFDFERDESGLPGMVVGSGLARILGLSVGDRATAFSMRTGSGDSLAAVFAGANRPRIKQFRIAGIYETSLSNFDELYAFTDLENARALLNYESEQLTRLDLTLVDVSRAADVADHVEETLGFPLSARTIYQVYSGLFAWVNLQEGIIPVVISVIVLVAAFNIVGTLLMLILEKTREIGILESMGASRRSLRRLFLWLGVFIGGLGTFLGQVTALVLALLQKRYNIIPLPEEAYYMKTAPIALSPVDFIVVGAIALGLCIAAAYIPARVAARVEPIRAIRFQ